jgi:putative NIF3 family GTP cyclohydrolase 1 type 2
VTVSPEEISPAEVYAYLRSLDRGWVDWEQSTDRIIIGPDDPPISGIAVGWMSYWWALRRAVDLDCNLFITHEPTFFSGHDDEEAIFRFGGARAKREWLRTSGLTVLRCHDVWDQLPELGVADSWVRFLGLGDPVAAEGFYRLTEVSGFTGRTLAQQVASRTARFGQSIVQLVGPPDTPVTRVATGTGAITSLPQLLDVFDLDAAICTDDGFTYWHAGALAIDLGIPVVVVNHAVSELHGIELLARHLADRYPSIPVRHIEQRCMFESVRAPEGLSHPE